MFKKSSSKNEASSGGLTPDVSASDERDNPQAFAMTSDNLVPAYSDSLKEAWGTAHQDLPQTQGAEKLLNNLGGLIIYSRICGLPTHFRLSLQPVV